MASNEIGDSHQSSSIVTTTVIPDEPAGKCNATNASNQIPESEVSSDTSIDEFFDAISEDPEGEDAEQDDEDEKTLAQPSTNVLGHTVSVVKSSPVIKPGHFLHASQMADSGIYSMHSSHLDTLNANCDDAKQVELSKPLEQSLELLSLPTTDPVKNELSEPPSSANTVILSNMPESTSMPRPPPRNRKKKLTLKQNIPEHIESGNNSSSGESRSMSNSIESTTHSQGVSLAGPNLANMLGDIASIKGDLSITEMDDRQSVYLDELMLNRQPNLRSTNLFGPKTSKSINDLKKNDFFDKINFDVENRPSLSTVSNEALKTVESKSVPETPHNVATNMDTGEQVTINESANDLMSNCLNPLSLHLMKLTNDFESESLSKSKSNSLEKGDHLDKSSETTLKSVTSLISSTINEIKSDFKDKVEQASHATHNILVKAKRNSLKEKKIVDKSSSLEELPQNETVSNFELIEHDEDEENDDTKSLADVKNGRFRSKFRDLKRLGSGFIRNVKNVKAAGGKEKSTFHVDLKSADGDSVPTAPRYKLKVNHKRGGADFEGLKLTQEVNDGRGAIWCMKFSNCGKLLAAAGQDHMMRVYCAQKSWKYFTQLRNKASGQHISPSSTKERGSLNGDSFGRKHRASYSRSGSLNANDSHNNSSSSSSSSAFAKELYKDEDNTLSEEGPFLLFTIYRGHTADVLDLAWSKNHFLLSSSMDKTVRLWHITRIECLCTFRHIDFVTTIQFHPRDDRYFLSGSLDGKLRLWNIPEKRVTLWNEVNPFSSTQQRNSSNDVETDMSPSHGLITASSFVQNGKFAVIGTYDGRIIFYTTDQLKYFTQIHVSSKTSITSSSGQAGGSSRGRWSNKVTGIESVDDNNKILVTTNDSRLRLYDLRDLSLTCKYKGCINQSSQIKASISHDHKYIICGSENNSFYIWRLQDNLTIGQRRDRNKQYECIRLLNPPPSQPPQPTSPIFDPGATFPTPGATTGQTSDLSFVESKKPSTGAKSTDRTFDGTRISSPSTTMASTSAETAESQSAPFAQTANAATKIVTAAIFAPVPVTIDDKAKYVIATADFNGFIRIFSKH